MMRISKGNHMRTRRFDQKSFCMYLFLVLLLVRFGFHNSYIVLSDVAVTCSTLLSGVLYIAVILKKRDPFGDFCRHIPFLLIGLISYLITGASAFLILLLAILILEDMDKAEVMKYYIVIRLLTILLIVAASLLGIIPNESMDVLKSGRYTFTLQAYGYIHPNQFAQAAGAVLIACICMVDRQYIYLKMAVLAAVTGLLFYLTRSRSLILIVGFVFLCKIVLESRKLRRIVLSFLEKCSWLPHAVVVFMGIICPFLMNYSSGILQKGLCILDSLFSGRYTFAAAVMRYYPLNLFGNVFDFSYLSEVYGTYAVDNGYINLLYSFGIIAFLCFLYLSYRTMKKMLVYNDIFYAVCIFALLLWGLFENMLTLPTINFAVLFYGIGVGNIPDVFAKTGKRRKRRS